MFLIDCHTGFFLYRCARTFCQYVIKIDRSRKIACLRCFNFFLWFIYIASNYSLKSAVLVQFYFVSDKYFYKKIISWSVSLTILYEFEKVWGSKWNERAYFSTRKVKLDHDRLCMAVLVQEVINADYAFVIHTTNPSSGDSSEIYAEV